MMRTERIQVDSDDEEAESDEEQQDQSEEDDSATPTPSTYPAPKASYPPVTRKGKKPAAPQIRVDGQPTGRKRDAIKKLFKNSSSSSRAHSPPPSKQSSGSTDANLLGVPSTSRTASDSSSLAPPPASAVRFTDSPLTLTPTSTLTPTGLQRVGDGNEHTPGHKRVSSLSGGSMGRSSTRESGGLLMTPGEFNGPTGGPGVTFELPERPA